MTIKLSPLYAIRSLQNRLKLNVTFIFILPCIAIRSLQNRLKLNLPSR